MEQRKPSIKLKSNISHKPAAPKSAKKESTSNHHIQRMNPFVLGENKKKRKRKPASNVLLEMQNLQNSTDLIIPIAPFNRLIRTIVRQNFEDPLRFTSLALRALQVSAEDYMVGLFQDSYHCSIHASRRTLFIQDMQLARRIRGRGDPGNGTR